MRKTRALLRSSIPLVTAAHYGGRQRPSAIVLRTSWTTDDKGAANGIAQAWHNPNNSIESCHYVVDEAQTIRCVPDKVVAYAFGSSLELKGAIVINVCHNPHEFPRPATMSQVAKLTAWLCKVYHLPVRILTTVEETRWTTFKWRRQGGIILKTVGAFSSTDFIGFVLEEYRRI